MISAAELGRLCRSGRYYDAIVTAKVRTTNSFLQAETSGAPMFYLLDMTNEQKSHVYAVADGLPPALSLSVGHYAVSLDLVKVWRVRQDWKTGRKFWCRLNRDGRERPIE